MARDKKDKAVLCRSALLAYQVLDVSPGTCFIAPLC